MKLRPSFLQHLLLKQSSHSRMRFIPVVAIAFSPVASLQASPITLTGNQSFNFGTGWADAASWSNNAAAGPGNDYLVNSGWAVHTPDGSGTQTFTGDSLTLGDASSTGTLRLNRGSTVGARTTIISDLKIVNGRIESTNWATLHTLQTNSGEISVEGPLTFRARSSDSQNRTAGFIIDASLTGNNVSLVHEGRSDASSVPNELRLIRANTVSGSIRVTDFGRLIVGHQNALQNLTLNMQTGDTGVVVFNQNSTVGALTGSRDLNFGGRTISVGNSNLHTTYSGEISNGALTVIGDGSLTLSGTNTYSGTTTVSAGTLLINGSLHANSAVSVSADATIGGTGTINGSLDFASTSSLEVVDIDNPLTVGATITFGSGFGIANILGLSWDDLDLNTAYTLIDTSQTFSASDIDNFGPANAVGVGSTGRQAYFTNGSLAVVVIPEPGAALLGGIGMLLLLRRRR